MRMTVRLFLKTMKTPGNKSRRFEGKGKASNEGYRAFVTFFEEGDTTSDSEQDDEET